MTARPARSATSSRTRSSTTTSWSSSAGATYQLTDCEAGDIEIAAAVTINGNGATIEQTCDNGVDDGVLYTEDDLTVRFVTITGGVANSGGGGIYAEHGDLTVYGSSIVDNFGCDNGGGIHVHDKLFVAYSTISGNTATYDGGAIANDSKPAGDITIFNSTITGNTGGEVGGIENDYADTYLMYSTVVDNTTDPTVTCPLTSVDDERDPQPSAQRGGAPGRDVSGQRPGEQREQAPRLRVGDRDAPRRAQLR